MGREMWQEYDCPAGGDCDIFHEAMLWKGATFKCEMWCGKQHVAGVDAKVHTYVIRDDGEMDHLPLPESLEELTALRAEFDHDGEEYQPDRSVQGSELPSD